jgi:hypothetical protein
LAISFDVSILNSSFIVPLHNIAQRPMYLK